MIDQTIEGKCASFAHISQNVRFYFRVGEQHRLLQCQIEIDVPSTSYTRMKASVFQDADSY